MAVFLLDAEISKTSMRAGMMGNHHNEYVSEVELLAAVRVRDTSDRDALEVIPAALVFARWKA
jgi:hypothetical protein